MRVVQGRDAHLSGRPSGDISDAGSGRSSAAGSYYGHLVITLIMTSVYLWEVALPFLMLICWHSDIILPKLHIKTSHNIIL